MEILSVQNLTFKYPNQEKNSLENVSFTVNSSDFILVCGESGCGKTTLLKMLKKELAPFGEKSGEIIFSGENDEAYSSAEIGFVMQNPENQIVTDKVYKELAFGLESKAEKSETIRLKTAEMASYFGIENIFRSDTSTLSGGQKQMLNLASIMVTNPQLLILDEPTSQLDPISADEFITTLKRLNSEFGLTIIISEHRLEKLFPISDKVLMLSNGKVQCYDEPKNTVRIITSDLEKQDAEKAMLSMPCASRIFYELSPFAKKETACPLTVKEGKRFLIDNFPSVKSDCESKAYSHNEEKAIELKNVWFRYERNSKDIMRGVNLTVYTGEHFCILGGNGTGKTTALSVICAVNKPYRGKIFIKNKNIKDYKNGSLYKGLLGFLPQNPQTVFVCDTVLDDMKELLKANEIPKDMHSEMIEKTAEMLSVTKFLDKHPYDLSGGEQQKCAIAKLLLLRPQILLLDEPTKGLDAYSKKSFAELLQKLKAKGITIITVTHDIEFAAEYADRCGLYFDGEIISADIPQSFFSKNSFYTTTAASISRGIYDDAVTCNDVVMCAKRSIGYE
ncbi:MAG: ABC transporter ATP-binding protein [Acutalibacteraceae bacterium]